MNDFTYLPYTTSFETAQREARKAFDAYCASNPIRDRIDEAETIEDLKNICLFTHALSIFLAKVDEVDIIGSEFDISAYLEGLANAVKEKGYMIQGTNVSPDGSQIVRRYGLE